MNNEDDVLHHFIINCLAGFPVIDESFNMKVDAWVNINKPTEVIIILNIIILICGFSRVYYGLNVLKIVV